MIQMQFIQTTKKQKKKTNVRNNKNEIKEKLERKKKKQQLEKYVVGRKNGWKQIVNRSKVSGSTRLFKNVLKKNSMVLIMHIWHVYIHA